MRSGTTYSYEKLILSVGSEPMQIPIPSVNLEGVFPFYKDMKYLKKAIASIGSAKNVLILGGGFIGMEFADKI